jgi:hypothetical protein
LREPRDDPPRQRLRFTARRWSRSREAVGRHRGRLTMGGTGRTHRAGGGRRRSEGGAHCASRNSRNSRPARPPGRRVGGGCRRSESDPVVAPKTPKNRAPGADGALPSGWSMADPKAVPTAAPRALRSVPEPDPSMCRRMPNASRHPACVSAIWTGLRILHAARTPATPHPTTTPDSRTIHTSGSRLAPGERRGSGPRSITCPAVPIRPARERQVIEWTTRKRRH